jgi:hypothetical protein
LDPNEPTLKSLFESIEHEYARALGSGMTDPVVVAQRSGPEDPERGWPFDVSASPRSEVIEWLSESCPGADELVASPDPTRPMTVVIAADGLSVFDCTADWAYANPAHRIIVQTCLEGAEMEWLRARERGMTDPAIELIEVAEVEPGKLKVGTAVSERSDLIEKLRPIAGAAAERLSFPPPPHTPLTIVVETDEGPESLHPSPCPPEFMSPGGSTSVRPPFTV